IASIVDAMARLGSDRMPQKALAALRSAEKGTFLHDLVTEAETRADHYLGAFLGTFDGLHDASIAARRGWAPPRTAADGSVDHGTSGLALLVFVTSQRWST